MMIGSGRTIAAPFDQVRMKVFNFARGEERGLALRALFAAHIVRDLIQEEGDYEVGGLYQVLIMDPVGVRQVSYFYWMPVDTDCGTYVAMRFEGGYWVQEHRPTGVKQRVESPFDILDEEANCEPDH